MSSLFIVNVTTCSDLSYIREEQMVEFISIMEKKEETYNNVK